MTRLRVTIWLSGEPYSGVDPDGDDYTPPGAFRTGFHNAHSGGGSDLLLFGGEPHVVESTRNIAGTLTRIVERMADGRLPVGDLWVRPERP